MNYINQVNYELFKNTKNKTQEEKENIMILLIVNERRIENDKLNNKRIIDNPFINIMIIIFLKYLNFKRINVLIYLYYLAKFFLSNLIKIK